MNGITVSISIKSGSLWDLTMSVITVLCLEFGFQVFHSEITQFQYVALMYVLSWFTPRKHGKSAHGGFSFQPLLQSSHRNPKNWLRERPAHRVHVHVMINVMIHRISLDITRIHKTLESSEKFESDTESL